MAKLKSKFTKKERSEFESWVNGELEEGAGLFRITARARKRYGAFDWAMIISLIMEIIKKWLESRKP